MANNLTGDFEAVLLVRLQQINGILATLHQNRAEKVNPNDPNSPSITPNLPHSVTLRVGEAPAWFDPEASQFAGWLSVAGRGLRDAPREHFLQRTPRGLRDRFTAAWDVFDAGPFGPQPLPTDKAVGRVDFQMSSPTISLPPGSVSQVVVHSFVRGRYVGDPAAGRLPAPIHGEVTALYNARVVPPANGRVVVRIQVTPDDNQIRFIPEPGTITREQAATLVAHVARALRTDFVVSDIEVGNSGFSEFKPLGSGPTEALTLPMQLSAAPTPGNIASVTNHFLGANDFAIGISREYVQQFLDALIEGIKLQVSQFSFRVSGPLGSATYRPVVSTLSIDWTPGAFEVRARIDLKGDEWWALDAFVSFVQGIALTFNSATQSVDVITTGEPSVDETWFIDHDEAVRAVRGAFDRSLRAAGPPITQTLKGALDRLAAALRSFDRSSSARYNSLEQTVDGLILRGEIGTRDRFSGVVQHDMIEGGAFFSAVRSWICGGRILRFDWSWVARTSIFPWQNQSQGLTIEHEFVCPRPQHIGVNDVASVCLQIHGTQIQEDGRVETISIGDVCRNTSHEPWLVLPSGWLDIHIPEWLPNPPPDFLLDDVIGAHIDVVAEPRDPTFITANTIVHVVGPNMNRPLTVLADALSQSHRRDLHHRVVLVLPRGSFNVRAHELEERLGQAGSDFGGQLLVTEDFTGGWTEALAPTQAASTYLVDGLGRFVWEREGGLDPRALAKALDDFAIDAPPPTLAPLRLRAESGAPALDHVFTDIDGNQFSLSHLRGRPVLMVFWRSWSAPSMNELRRMKRVTEQRQAAPFVVAINGGEPVERIRETRARNELNFALINDPGRVIAADYGVRAWPTTIAVGEDGTIQQVQFGMVHQHTDPRPE
jgi:peroxiredoxin